MSPFFGRGEGMNYEEAIAYIQNFQSNGISLGLERMRELCTRLAHPQKKLRFIHIAGTNGKGSTAAYISSILGVNGYLVGRYVSPVVFQYEECIQFEDSRGIAYIDRDLLAEVVTEVAFAVASMEQEGYETPTIFEVETAMALLAFVKRECQIVVLEVGLGGREDATNVIEHVLASVITPISRDHMGMLGDTLREIATEKAGIIREGVPVISMQEEPEVIRVLTSVCAEKKSELTMVRWEDMKLLHADLQGILFSYQGENFRTQMLGTYQMENACLAIETCRRLNGAFAFDEVQLMLGIREAQWRGRFEVVSKEPLIVVDGAHNVSGAKALRNSIETFLAGKRLHGVMGVFRDKEYESMVAVLQPLFHDVVTVKAPTERGLDADILAKVWQDAGCERVSVAEGVVVGLKKAIEQCKQEDAVVLFGSLSLLRELE